MIFFYHLVRLCPFFRTIQLIHTSDIEPTYHRTQKLQLHSYQFYLILATSSNIRWQHWMKANGLCSWRDLSFQQRALVYLRHSHSTYGSWFWFHCSLLAHWYIASSSYVTVWLVTSLSVSMDYHIACGLSMVHYWNKGGLYEYLLLIFFCSFKFNLKKQFSTLSPISDSTRLMFATWWIFITILTSFYTANLTAFLTLSRFTLPINNWNDLYRSETEFVSVKGGCVEYAILNVSIHNIFHYLLAHFLLG